MKNLHQKTKLMSSAEINKIEKALEMAWSKETTDPESKKSWSKNNKAKGQCAVTAILINDLFGGRMIYDKKNFHIWNELSDGSRHDFSRLQFKGKKIFSIYKFKTRKDILYDKRGKRTKILQKYNLLKKRFYQALKKMN